ncbi:uncharacterized protein LOC112521991 [Cynara cardunculus var. scolymus]|uniref:uncharacterized protein LOC112521991 n=1 Tax=Cynara cardunculus var. scolymus TaxID=59895 RepID=UPI000D62A3AF|nr:uncharacterized protein LOC112521991 [Cynara cardunculus var. scolymus]
MEKPYKTIIISHHVLLITIIIISFSIASFAFCIISEFTKSKKTEIRVDGELCYLARSKAFGYGIAALICSVMAQIVGTGFFVLCRRSTDSKSSNTCFATILLSLSWMSFFIVTILVGTATTMNQRQVYGEGWVDGKCYLVKNGVYVGSGILVLIATSSTLLSCYLELNKSRAVHAQMK